MDNDNDLLIDVKRDENGLITQGFIIGDTLIQNAYVVLSLNQGELKEDPIAGVNLISLIRGKENKERIKSTIKIGFQRCGIDFEEVKGKIRIEGVEL